MPRVMSLIAVAIFIATSAAVANRENLLDDSAKRAGASKLKAATRPGFTAAASAYRSPSSLRKVVIQASDARALERATASGAIELADYQSFKLFALEQPALEREEERRSRGAKAQREGDSAPQLLDSLASFTVRDDFNVLFLRSGAIDTTAEDAPGDFLGLGRAAPADQARTSALGQSSSGSRLRLIQFVGPVKGEWLDRLRASGIEPIAYVPNNGYLVRGDAQASARMLKLAESDERFIQWEGEFETRHKVHPALADSINTHPDTEVTVAIQVARSGLRKDPRQETDIRSARRLAASLIGDAYEVSNFANLKMTIAAAKIPQLAALPNLVNIEPWTPPQLFDERANQIVAGNLTADGKSAKEPGYLGWLATHGFSSQFSFAIDVTDTGMDRGATTPDQVHPDFLNAQGQSRVLYARDYTSELDGGDVGGHGTINLSIAGGANTSSAAGARDSAGFSFGLGVAPFVLLGSSKIFQSTGRFDLIEPYTKLISEAYRDGARVSSNSWGSISNSYTIESQEYDLRVRDAATAQPGNQEFQICFAAGNSGPSRVISSPGTAKNVISVAASENSRKDGADGCGVDNDGADSALDMADFSSGGPTDDLRIKPDVTAPGTHIQGAASQHLEFNGDNVCGEDFGKPYFPAGQTLYTWSSGTSHSTPQVAGAAALVRQFFLNRGEEPSAAIIKALLLGTATYLTGEGAGGNLPHPRQGWGLVNLNRAFDGASKIFVNQSTLLAASGQEFVLTGEVKDSAVPFRVMVVWSDAPGFSGFAPWVNDLDLEVSINGQVYRGNNFNGQESKPGGDADTRNNVEAVWLPAGTVGTFVVRVRGTNIAGDGVPGNADSTDQDFALVVYNGENKDAAVAAFAGATLAGGGDEFADPGETVEMRLRLGDLSPVTLTGGHATLSTTTTGVTVTAAVSDFPNIAQGQTAEGLTPFSFTIAQSVSCGTSISFVLDVSSQGLLSRIPFTVTAGRLLAIELFADDVESGESKWTHNSLIKKKKNRLDTWKTSQKRVRSGSTSWFTPDIGAKVTDSFLASTPIVLPTDARTLELVFYHTFEFERGGFDGGVIEISTGGDFEDLGPKILMGGYNGTVFDFFFNANPLRARTAWVEGRLGAFQQVIVDLSSYAGKTVTIRFRIGTDQTGKGLGWYIDDVSLRGERAICTP
ncbi:MAG TPA: S8 family serine peptidase [Blastocatellia bacterium]|nr:S8 family serine peptidase [Blastocatellia bacterium]